MLSFLLFYFIVILFLYYSVRNKKPAVFEELLNILTLNQYYQRYDTTKRVPGPMQLPIIGTNWNLWFKNMSKLHEHYAELNEKYGDVVMEYKGNIPIVSLFNRKDIEKLLKYPSKYPFRPPNEITVIYRTLNPKQYNTVGLVNTQGLEWAALRPKLAPNHLQNRKFLSNFCPDLNSIFDDFISAMKLQRSGENVVENVQLVSKSMFFESVCCLVFGRRMGFFSDSGADYQELSVAANNLLKSIRDAYYGSNLWKYFPTKVYRTFAKNEDILYDAVKKIMKQSAELAKLEGENEMAAIINSIQNAEGLDERDKITGVMDIITAGIEVMSHSVSFMFHYLSDHPEVQEKIFEESLSLNEELTSDDYMRASYTRAAVQEAFRMSPSAFAIARILEEDMTFSGHTLKAGSIVLCQNMIACNKEENFKNATEYKPERWLTESGDFDANLGEASSLVLPFGTGKRICPGKKFFELELTLFIIKLVRAFRIKYHSEYEMNFEFLVVPKSPTDIQFTDRS